MGPNAYMYEHFAQSSVGIYKWNEIEMNLRRRILSNMKSLQILISVT